MAYLLFVVAVSAVGIAVVVRRHRGATPRTVDASIDRFARARSAIAPEARPRAAGSTPNPVRRDQQRRHRIDARSTRPAPPAAPPGPTE